MNVVIVGGGLVGSSLAAKLSSDGHDVVLVERNRELVRDLDERLDVQTICGNGTTVPVLRQAGIESCDLLLATTDSDEANMVVALVGSALFRVPRVVARLRDEGHEESLRSIASEIGGERLAINPDSATVERILSLMAVPGAVDVAPFFGGKLQVAGFVIREGSDFNGLLLSHLKLLFPAVPMLVVAIRREGRWLVPHGDDELMAGDLVYFAMDPAETDTVLTLLDLERGPDRKVMIAGATRIGLELARRLEALGVSVTLVERSWAACEAAAASLDSTMVIHGSPTDRDVLLEEGIEHVKDFLACADSHEENVVACLLARKLGASHTIALVDNAALAGLIGDVGIDAVISPRLLSVSLALQFARRGQIKAVAALLDDEVEVFEVEAGEGSRLVRSPLAKLGLPKGVLVAAVHRYDTIVVPHGGYRIEAGDEVLLITTTKRASMLDGFLEGQ